MNKLFFYFIFISFPLFAQTNNLNNFLSILSKIESNNNDHAAGDNGKALGRYQIHRGCFKDAQEYDKYLKVFKYEDVTNKYVADKVVMAYINRYEKGGTYEAWAKLWNGGPNWRKAAGQKKKNLDNYYYKFKKIQNKI